MSDDELLKKIRLGMGYLLARGRMLQCDEIRELCSRYAAARAEADRLKSLVREVLDADKGTIDPPTVQELEDLLGGQDALAAATTDASDTSVTRRT